MASNNVDGMLLPWQNEDLLDQSAGKFMGYLIFTLGSIGTNGRGQLFYHTLGCNFYGLPRDGIHYLSRYGFASNIRDYDDRRNQAYHRSKEMSRYHIVMLLTCFAYSLYIPTHHHAYVEM